MATTVAVSTGSLAAAAVAEIAPLKTGRRVNLLCAYLHADSGTTFKFASNGTELTGDLVIGALGYERFVLPMFSEESGYLHGLHEQNLEIKNTHATNGKIFTGFIVYEYD